MASPAPKLSRFPRIPIIWFVPVVAIGIAGWMLYREWRSHGPEITIDFADGSGVEPRQTKLEYKGVEVGEVKEVRLGKDLRRVFVRVQLAKNAASIAREGAQFWIVQPEIGFGGVSGLETLLSGAKLGVKLGDGPETKNFHGLEVPPSSEKVEEGRAFLLKTDRVGGLQVHAPVFYRDVKVGEVETARLAEDSTGVVIRIRVQNAFVPLVRTNTRFWNAGGSPIQFSLFGGGSQKHSLQSVITGAIGFATPTEPGEIAADGAVYSIAMKPEDDWLKWSPYIPIKVTDPSPQDPAPPNPVPGLLGGH